MIEKVTAYKGERLDVFDLAEIHHVEPNSIRQQIHRGVIPAYHIGRRLYIDKQEYLMKLKQGY